MNEATGREVATQEQNQALQPVQTFQATPAQMLQAVVEGKITDANLATFKQLMAMNAEREFSAAFVALQADMPRIVAKTAVPNNDGTVRYKFAAYEDIMEQVRPYLQRHGFTLAFSQRFSEGTPQRLVAICTLTHTGGHSRSNEFAVRVGSGPPKASEAQADGAAGTYAKRFALCNALNIVIEKDSDAKAEGAPITAEEAADLEKRVRASGMPVDIFLKFCGGAKSFSEIAESHYQPAIDLLRSKATASTPEREIIKKIWDALKPVRGAENNWLGAEIWLVAKKIIKDSETVVKLPLSRLQEILEKVQIALEP